MWLEAKLPGIQYRIPSSKIANYIFRHIYFTKQGLELYKHKDTIDI